MTALTVAALAMPILAPRAWAQNPSLHAPATATAGSVLTVQTSGSGQATLWIAGPGGAVRRTLSLGDTVTLPSGTLYNAGVYVVALTAGSSQISSLLTITPQPTPDSLSFIAGPSRLPVGLHDGVSGTAYVFDAYHNLVETSLPVEFSLSTASAPTQTRTVQTRYGVAWTKMDSAPRQGNAQFVARAAAVTSTSVIDQVPGEPCSLTFSATRQGDQIALATAPIHDCTGNPISDGTIVTFTETHDGTQSTVDVPVKKDIASALMPAENGALLSVASGLVAGNQIRWSGGR